MLFFDKGGGDGILFCDKRGGLVILFSKGLAMDEVVKIGSFFEVI
ncbi:phospho-N-acetylmuramoyl-pentapeptide-transferase [Rickettsia akari str. Hartford]|uniref:Phospho-N-acetylmuramoyl-pentapeptide-transferase n=1 Tax=Rickettsia akari (strain Hartford) TaxID=293614 RepID=A8GP68_RICAH|nr:phospho-N-acetylmuramoyl-pentapeptide-transferase [Rickettsia akari str. Hartford]